MKQIPRIHFAHLPTPVEFMPRLTQALSGPDIYIKRDDQTGLALGGNKTRKLEYFVADAQAKGAKTLITAGAMQSNHCRQTAAAAAKFGFECILILTKVNLKSKLSNEMLIVEGNKESEHPHKTPDGNFLLDQLFGAQIVWTEPENREIVLHQNFNKAVDEGKKPYLIPYGGSNPVGAMGYMTAMLELFDQLQTGSLPDGKFPEWIVFPSSSGGTQAGLVLGASICGYKGKIQGISVDEKEAVLKSRVANLANETALYIGENIRFSEEDILVNDHYLGKGYGVMGKVEQEAIQLFGRYEGVILDPVYTGRAAGGLIDLIRKGFFSAGQSVIFWHTGGTPALFADRYQSELFS